MRWVVVALLVLNLGYFGWQSVAPAPVATAADIPPGKRLMLLVEQPETMVRLNGRAGTAIPGTATDAGHGPTSTASVAEIEERPPLTEHVRKETAAGQAEDAKQTRKGKPALACYSLGPFASSADAGRAVAAVEKAGLTVQQRAGTERKQVGYWVYVAPQKSLADARNVLRDLKEREIGDAIIIAEGEKENAVSVGVFPIQAQADERRARVEAAGYRVIVDPLYRTQPQYWLDIEFAPGEAAMEAAWAQVRRDFAEVGSQGRKCD